MTIVNVLGESALRSLALGLLVAAGLRLLRVQNVRIAKRAWTAVLVLAIAMPALVALRIPSFAFTAVWATPRILIAPAASSPANLPHLASFAVLPQETAPPVTLAVPIPSGLRGSVTPQRHLPWVYTRSSLGFAAYLAISALMLLRVLTGLGLAARLWGRAQVFATRDSHLSVRITPELHSPVTLGHGILLPLEAMEWDEATLRTTLAHEAAHVREGDFSLQLAAALHLCFFWISPLAWWLRPQLARLSETICDRDAVQSSGDGLGYAQLLLRFANTERTPSGLVAMAQSAGLRERVERLIVDPELTSAFRQRRGQPLGAALLLAVSAFGAAATVRLLQPETAVLAAPQTPAPPTAASSSAPAAAPSDATPLATVPSVAPEASSASAPIPRPEHNPQASAAPAATPAPEPAPVPQSAMAAPSSPSSITIGDESTKPYAIVNMDGNGSSILHGSNRAAWQALRHNNPGGAIWFERDGKSYFIDDPLLVKQARDAYAPVEQLGQQQSELGKRQGILGKQQGQLGALQGLMGEKQGEWQARRIESAQDFKFELPQGFDAAVSQLTDSSVKLAMERDTMNSSQRAALEAQQKAAQANLDTMMAQIHAQEPALQASARQMRENAEQMRKQLEPLIQQMHEMAAKQGSLAELQSSLGRQQSQLGLQQRLASREADRQVQSLIDQALRDGKARPAQ